MSERGPAFVVAACIVRNGEVLLAQRNQPESPNAHLRWELPGGKVKLKESPHEALIREIHEELGTKIEVVRLLPHVQSNIYLTTSETVHSIVLAFEAVLSRGAPAPTPQEKSVLGVRWTKPSGIDRFSLLPGTRQFVQCLERLDRATCGSEYIFVRLERPNTAGQPRDFWELRALVDFWHQYNVHERHGNVITRSSHYRFTSDLKPEDVLEYLISRIRTLARLGYRITTSDDPRLAAGI